MAFKFFLFIFTLSFITFANAANSSKPLKGDDLEEAKAMNEIYARHMLSSNCLERQKINFIPSGISEKEKLTRLDSFRKNCDCITDVVLESYSPNDVIDYVTQMFGSASPLSSNPKKAGKAVDTQQRQKYAKMMYMMNVDKENRKKCGFQK